MSGFHHLWIVEVELEIANPSRHGDGPSEPDPCAARFYEALTRYAGDETAPYPTQVTRNDDGWLEATFPVWAPTRWAAIAAGAALLSEACAHAEVDAGVARIAAGTSSGELRGYRERVAEMGATG